MNCNPFPQRNQVIANGTLKRYPADPSTWSGATGQLSFAAASDVVYNGYAARWTSTGDNESLTITGILPTNFVAIEKYTASNFGYFAFDYYSYKVGGDAAAVSLVITITVNGNTVSAGYTPLQATGWAAARARKQRIDIGALFVAAGYSIKPGDQYSIEFALSEAAGNALVVVPDPHAAIVIATHDATTNNTNAVI